MRTMTVFFFTASSISCKQTSYRDRNVIEENNDWIFSQHFQYHANKQGVKTETLCYINGSDG